MKTVEVSEILKTAGPSLSSLVSQKLQQNTGVTAVAARKQIERAKQAGLIKAFGELQLKSNDQFLYLEEHESTGEFRKALFSALVETRSAYAKPLLGLMARGGIIPYFVFPTISALPVQAPADSSHLVADDALSSLINWGLVYADETKAGYCVMFTPVLSEKRLSDKRLAARLVTEQIVLTALKDWYFLQGLTGAAASIRSDESPPQFAYFQWDFVAPSYISALRSISNSKISPGFLVADVILGRKLSEADVSYFIDKCNTIRKRHRNKPFIPFLIAEWFDKEALNLGRKHGFVFTTVKNLFGKPFYQAIDSISQVIDNKAKFETKTHDFIDLIAAISHMANAVEIAKTTIFELILVSLFTHEEYNLVEYNRLFNDFENNIACEIDVVIHQNATIQIFNCKDADLSYDRLRDWFGYTVPLVHSILTRQRRNEGVQKFHYVYCSSAQADQSIRDLVSSIKSSELPYTVDFLDVSDLNNLVKTNPRLETLFNMLCPAPITEL